MDSHISEPIKYYGSHSEKVYAPIGILWQALEDKVGDILVISAFQTSIIKAAANVSLFFYMVASVSSGV